MSRLPGGLFVGVVTLLCGLGFAQLERVSRDRSVSTQSDSTLPDQAQSESPRSDLDLSHVENTLINQQKPSADDPDAILAADHRIKL
jgi:hypothetical protein